MVLQDITAVLALSIVPAFEVVSDPAERGVDLVYEISVVLGVLIAVVVLLFFLSRYALPTIFKYFALDGEMLFIGTMAYNLGASAICSQVGFSPMIGSYFAGFSLSCLPYRHQIEHKISSLRGYGMTTFYFLLGIYVQLRYMSAFIVTCHSS